MTTNRITWADVQRAASRLADVWQQVGGQRPDGVDLGTDGPPPYTGPTKAALYVTPGSLANGHAAELTWTGPNAAGIPIPGGQRLARSARDSYDMVTQRTATILDVIALTGRKTDVERPIYAILADDLTEYAGHPLTDDELFRFGDAFPMSSVGECISAVVGSIIEDPQP